MTRIKFCGMKRAEDAGEAERVGASYIGVILTASPRRVSVDEAARVFDAAPSLRRVGVIAKPQIGSVSRIARDLDLHVIQLHGAFTSEDSSRIRDEFDGEIWMVAMVDEKTGALAEDWRRMADASDALLLDTSARGRTGGTGRTFNWNAASALVKEITKEIPVVLAGGLNPGNVEHAIHTFKPAVVDVSSGVEVSPGIKDPGMMAAFANAVRSASIV